MIPVTLIASVMLAMIAVEVARAELRVAIFSLLMGVLVLIGYRKIHFALGDWARSPVRRLSPNSSEGLPSRVSALAVTSQEPRAEGKPEVFWLASASIGFALFGAIMTAMATLVLLQVSG
jgi:hypothetical protein